MSNYPPNYQHEDDGRFPFFDSLERDIEQLEDELDDLYEEGVEDDNERVNDLMDEIASIRAQQEQMHRTGEYR